MGAPQDHTKMVPEFVQNLYMLSSSLILFVCQPLLGVLSVPYELLIPDHTRDALFQLACDLRANPIKDKHWVLVHWRRLKPRTFPGWIAMGWAGLFVASAGTGVAGLALCGLLGILYTLGFILAFAGVVGSLVVGTLLTCVAFWCFIAACITGFMCAGAGFAYCGTSSVWAVLGFLSSRLNPPSRQDAAVKPLHSLAPVATPRALSPQKAPAASEKEAALRSSPGHPNALPAINPTSPRFAAVPPVVTGLACGSVSTSQEMTNPVLEDAELEAGIAEQVANAKAILEETSKGSSASESIGPLAQPVDATAAIALQDSASSKSGSFMMAQSAAEALKSPHDIGMAGSRAAGVANGNGIATHAKHHKAPGGKAHPPQRKASQPGQV